MVPILLTDINVESISCVLLLYNMAISCNMYAGNVVDDGDVKRPCSFREYWGGPRW